MVVGRLDLTTRRRALAIAWSTLVASVVPSAARAAQRILPWPADRAAPLLELDDLDGRPWHVAAQRGRPVLLNFWASWCPPCRAEMPSLELLATRHERDGLVVVAIDYQEPIPAIRRFLQVISITLPILLDRDGTAALAWTRRVFPTTVLVDRDGQPRVSVLGELDWTGAEARALVEPLLGRPGSAPAPLRAHARSTAAMTSTGDNDALGLME